MHLSFCLLLFASLFGVTVQKCCQYPLYIPPKLPLNYQPFTLPHKVQWNGCDQPIVMGCAINGGYSDYWYRILGNFSTVGEGMLFPNMLLNYRSQFLGKNTIDLKCDTQTGLWFYDFPDNAYIRSLKYRDFCCN